MFVLDASIALAWCFEDEPNLEADLLLERVVAEDAAVPAIWPLEVANGLWSAQRTGRLNPVKVPAIRQVFAELPIHVESVSTEAALGEVLELARTHELSAYDASYLALAMRLAVPLATADARLQAAATRAGVELA